MQILSTVKTTAMVCAMNLVCSLFFVSVVQGQQYVSFVSADNTNNSIQILAVDKMSFSPDSGIFEAVGQSEVVYGELVVLGDRAEAQFETDAEGKRAIQSFTSSGSIYFSTKTIEGQSDMLMVDIVNGRYLFEGNDIQILTETERMFSNKSILIDEKTHVIEVVGSDTSGAAIVRMNNTIIADTLILNFTASSDENKFGELEMLHAVGNVSGNLGSTQISADRLVTDSNAIDIQLYGHVIVAQDDTVLNGDCMKYNVDTGDAVLFRCNPQSFTNKRTTGWLPLTQ